LLLEKWLANLEDYIDLVVEASPAVEEVDMNQVW
jgi:hypothetical protein